MNDNFTPKITLFHCINTVSEIDGFSLAGQDNLELETVKLPCSSMVKDVFLLRAFEAGSDAVIVLVCPEGQCRYVEGNIRAKKRVAWVRNLLDEVGIGGRRLSLSNLSAGDNDSASRMIRNVLRDLEDLGPNPAV